MKNRYSILQDLVEMRSHQTKRTKYLLDMKEILTIHHITADEGDIGKAMRGLVEDYRAILAEDCCVEDVLLKAIWRRLRNIYVMLMEICQKDEAVLGW